MQKSCSGVSMTVSISQEKCDHCGTCISVCPANALMLLTETLLVDTNRCTCCGLCVAVCPFGALQPFSSETVPPNTTGTGHG
jgi:ferredoxin